MIIRHGEKPASGDPAGGVDAKGKSDPRSLTPRGWQRAQALVALFDPVGGNPRQGISRPTAIYAPSDDSGSGTRPRETVAPLAARLGVRLDTVYSKGQESELAQRVAESGGTTLISWEHTEIPDIVTALGPATPAPPSSWPDDRFDVVWVFTATDRGWAFTQVPELVLPGDSPSPITP